MLVRMTMITVMMRRPLLLNIRFKCYDEPVIDQSESRKGVEELWSKSDIETSNLQSSWPDQEDGRWWWIQCWLRMITIVILCKDSCHRRPNHGLDVVKENQPKFFCWTFLHLNWKKNADSLLCLVHFDLLEAKLKKVTSPPAPYFSDWHRQWVRETRRLPFKPFLIRSLGNLTPLDPLGNTQKEKMWQSLHWFELLFQV